MAFTERLYWLPAESRALLQDRAQQIVLAYGGTDAFKACMDLLEQHLSSVRQSIFDEEDSWEDLQHRHLLVRALKDICLTFRQAAMPEKRAEDHEDDLEARLSEEMAFFSDESRALVLDTMGGDPASENDDIS